MERKPGMTHTILGAGGFAGNALAIELLKAGHSVRLVSRRGFELPGTSSIRADLLQRDDVIAATAGSTIVYLCAGLPYNAKTWADQWPRVMANTIEACKRANAKLVFFDNAYMYGKVNGAMTESTSYHPCSRKGEVRTRTTMMLQEEMRNGSIKALIARAADVYGPFATNTSVPYLTVFSRLLQEKTAQWIGNPDALHSHTYTLDCARGMMLLASQDDCYGQIWHLPTASPATTGKEFIECAAKELGVSSRYSILHGWMLRLAGLFNTTAGESYEMLYERTSDYVFDSSKFEKRFGYTPTPYTMGIRETIDWLKKL